MLQSQCSVYPFIYFNSERSSKVKLFLELSFLHGRFFCLQNAIKDVQQMTACYLSRYVWLANLKLESDIF